ncbi:methyl-accepting chemotaxis protein [Paludibacterium sp.]|uniref:methyl-accepting chemotaxis protein n=1 Tax=Paludibacterium sp. TaxID=1917523 RepID=UPI0026014033|nr:methyl-accepting chemotaxis protein [Paludibacterium sp.]
MMVSVAGILIISLLLIILLAAHLMRAALTERVEQYELVRTVEAVRNDLDKSVSIPMAQTLQIANNTFLLDWMAQGEPASGIAPWQKYAQRVRAATGAAMVSWVSEATHNYYDDSKGLLRKVNPDGDDGWFKAFLDSGKTVDFNLGGEDGKPNIMMFVNGLVKGPPGHRAIASIGIDVTEIANRVRQTAIGQTGQVYVVDTDGKIQIHRDLKLVKINNKVDMRSLPGMSEVTPTLLKPSNFNLGHYAGPQGPMVVVSSYMPDAGWIVVVEIAESEIYASVNHVVAWLSGIGLVVLLFSLTLIATVANSITKPLGKLRQAMQSLSSGHGDLTLRLAVESRDEVGEIATNFNHFMSQLHQKFIAVREQTSSLNGSVSELGQMTHHLTQNSRDITQLAETTAATIEQLTVSVAHIATNTQEAAAVVEQASGLSTASVTSMSKVSAEISHAAHSMTELTPVMANLDENSKQIGSVARVIKEIADQTNLLALNASIEAARAGEQGRGFAVVADEVRKLAERTGLATVEIDQMVAAMRQASELAIGRVSQTSDAVNTGVSLIEAALSSIADIQNSMAAVIRKTIEIRDATTEQSRATEVMSKSAEQMSTRAQDEDAQIKHTEVITQSLAEMSDGLDKVVGGFKL